MSCRLPVWRGWPHFVLGQGGQDSASRPPHQRADRWTTGFRSIATRTRAQPAKTWPRTASRLEPRTALNDVKDAFADLGLLPQPPDSHLQTRTINNDLLSDLLVSWSPRLLFVDREGRIPYLPVRCMV